MSADVTVAACDQSTLRPTLEWLYREQPSAEQYKLAESAASELSGDDLIAASRGGAIVGAIMTQVAAGRVGWLFAPTVAEPGATSSSRRPISERLIAAGIARLKTARVRIAQALLPLDAEFGDLLEQNGFRRFTEMIRMVCRCEMRKSAARESPDLEFVSFDDERRHVFEDIVARTYESSRDCPELDGLRPVSDVLDSYRAGGNFRPELWQLASHGGEFVGCVLLTEFADEHRCELQYMGVMPAARGQRLGLSLCSRAISLANECGAHELWLSVDARNEPAIRHYRTAGFDEIERRRVYILRFSADTADG